jgi:hypothetical protein
MWSVVGLILMSPIGAVREGLRKPTPQALNQIQAEEELLAGFRTGGEELAGKFADLHESCDMSASGPVCSSQGERFILPPAVPLGLVGYWSFNEEVAYDHSGNSNHGVTETLSGPSPTGHGSSAFFRKTFLTVPNSEQFATPDFSYSFWVYLIHDASATPASDGQRYCPLLRKGINDASSQQFASSPSILVDRMTRRLRVSLTTTADGSEAGEILESNAHLGHHQWMHVAVVRLHAARTTQLYVNGILDAAAQSKGDFVANNFPLYIGSDPFAAEHCDMPVYMDDVKAYSRSLVSDEIEAQASPALTGVEPGSVRLACPSCPVEVAASNCPPGFHICTALELHTGGYQVARTMGWLGAGGHVWTHGSIKGAAMLERGAMPASALLQQGQTPTLGLGLCCAGTF